MQHRISIALTAAAIASLFFLSCRSASTEDTTPAPHIPERRADSDQVKADIAAINEAVEHYAINNGGRFPDTLRRLGHPGCKRGEVSRPRSTRFWTDGMSPRPRPCPMWINWKSFLDPSIPNRGEATRSPPGAGA